MPPRARQRSPRLNEGHKYPRRAEASASPSQMYANAPLETILRNAPQPLSKPSAAPSTLSTTPCGAASTKTAKEFKTAAQGYLNNDRFSDFTIVCEGRESKVHRCFICLHSKWFERCCEGTFKEGQTTQVELKEDFAEVVEKTIQFFYLFDYDDVTPNHGPRPTGQRWRPIYKLEMHALVYAMADKYDVPNLKALALEKFRVFKDVFNADAMIGAVWTLENQVQLPDGEQELHKAILEMWFVGGKELVNNIGEDRLKECMADIPDFMSSMFIRMVNLIV